MRTKNDIPIYLNRLVQRHSVVHGKIPVSCQEGSRKFAWEYPKDCAISPCWIIYRLSCGPGFTEGRPVMSKIVKILLTICLTVSLLGNLVYPTFAQEAPKKLLVAYAGLISTHTSVWLGEDQGFFKKHGLDVSSVFTGSGSVTSQALLAGEAKVASTSVGPTAGAVSGGGDLVILAGLIHILPYQFWVTPQARQPADLKGKRVA